MRASCMTSSAGSRVISQHSTPTPSRAPATLLALAKLRLRRQVPAKSSMMRGRPVASSRTQPCWPAAAGNASGHSVLHCCSSNTRELSASVAFLQFLFFWLALALFFGWPQKSGVCCLPNEFSWLAGEELAEAFPGLQAPAPASGWPEQAGRSASAIVVSEAASPAPLRCLNPTSSKQAAEHFSGAFRKCEKDLA